MVLEDEPFRRPAIYPFAHLIHSTFLISSVEKIKRAPSGEAFGELVRGGSRASLAVPFHSSSAHSSTFGRPRDGPGIMISERVAEVSIKGRASNEKG